MEKDKMTSVVGEINCPCCGERVSVTLMMINKEE